jgi:hypothetical protein
VVVAGVAVLALVAIVVAVLATRHSSSHGSHQGAGPGSTIAIGATTPGPSSTASPVSTSIPIAGPAGGPVPAGFEPGSVTFVSPDQGWVLGSAPCAAPPCASIVRTRDGGRTWAGIPAPAAGYRQSPGVSSLRFATSLDGWASAPDLWSTHDGGATWRPVTLPTGSGTRVFALEASGGSATAVVIAPDNSAHLLTTPVGRDDWRVDPLSLPIGAGPVPSAQLVLQGHRGWVAMTNRVGVGGARLVSGRWQAGVPSCPSGGADRGMWAASSELDVVWACVSSGFGSEPYGRLDALSASNDGGATFHAWPTVGAPTAVGLLASPPGRSQVVVVPSQAGLVATFDAGRTWVAVSQGAGQGSWTDLGFTTPDDGVVVAGAPGGSGAVLLVTRDGGHHWSALPIA